MRFFALLLNLSLLFNYSLEYHTSNVVVDPSRPTPTLVERMLMKKLDFLANLPKKHSHKINKVRGFTLKVDFLTY